MWFCFFLVDLLGSNHPKKMFAMSWLSSWLGSPVARPDGQWCHPTKSINDRNCKYDRFWNQIWLFRATFISEEHIDASNPCIAYNSFHEFVSMYQSGFFCFDFCDVVCMLRKGLPQRDETCLQKCGILFLGLLSKHETKHESVVAYRSCTYQLKIWSAITIGSMKHIWIVEN